MTILSVCIGSSCHINGSYNVIQTFQQLIEENHLHEKIDFKAEFCSKMCSIKRSEENPLMTELYNGVLKNRVHELLHTHYGKQGE